MKEEMMKKLETIEKAATEYAKEIENCQNGIKRIAEGSKYSTDAYLTDIKRYTKDIEAYREYLYRLELKITTIEELAYELKNKADIQEVEDRAYAIRGTFYRYTH